MSEALQPPDRAVHEALSFDDGREHVPFPLLEVDAHGSIHRANTAARLELGPIPSALTPLMGAAAAQEVMGRLDRARREGNAPPWSSCIGRPGAEQRTVALSLSPIVGPPQAPWRAQLAIAPSPQPRRDIELPTSATALGARRVDAAASGSAARRGAVQSLATGVAHEIGNPLTYVLMCLDELERGIVAAGKTEQLGPLTTRARQGAERVRDVVRGLSSYDHDRGRRERVNVNATVRSALDMARPELRPGVHVHTSLESIPSVQANPSRLTQVLYNLLVNAAHALDPHAQSEAAFGIETWAEGSWVYINVWDTGPGIDPSIRDRIFEPFVTSKPAGHGAGLGLAVCHNYVAELQGELDFDCEPGQGTRFTVRLPAEAPQARAAGILDEAPAPAAVRLLVVDDEPEIRRGLQAMLKRFGDVDVAESAAEARSLLGPGQHYDLVLCDLSMPGESGEELYGWITSARPDLAARVAYVTGGGLNLNASISGETAVDGPPCLLKPFRRQELYEFVRRNMARSRASVDAGRV